MKPKGEGTLATPGGMSEGETQGTAYGCLYILFPLPKAKDRMPSLHFVIKDLSTMDRQPGTLVSGLLKGKEKAC